MSWCKILSKLIERMVTRNSSISHYWWVSWQINQQSCGRNHRCRHFCVYMHVSRSLQELMYKLPWVMRCGVPVIHRLLQPGNEWWISCIVCPSFLITNCCMSIYNLPMEEDLWSANYFCNKLLPGSQCHLSDSAHKPHIYTLINPLQTGRTYMSLIVEGREGHICPSGKWLMTSLWRHL